MSWIITPEERTPLDQDYRNVSLLLHGDGTNGSTTIVDSSPTPKTVTAVGDAQISTAQSKFGGSSLAFDGNGDWLTVANTGNINFGSDAFTVEAWIYQSQNVATYAPIFASNGSNVGGLELLVSNTRSLAVYFAGWVIAPTTTKYSLNQWNHVAFVKQSTGLSTIYLNGISIGSGTLNQSPSFNDIRIGTNPSAPNGEIFVGYIDEFRITKGVARYTSNFTPPTAPFPDAGPAQ